MGGRAVRDVWFSSGPAVVTGCSWVCCCSPLDLISRLWILSLGPWVGCRYILAYYVMSWYILAYYSMVTSVMYCCGSTCRLIGTIQGSFRLSGPINPKMLHLSIRLFFISWEHVAAAANNSFLALVPVPKPLLMHAPHSAHLECMNNYLWGAGSISLKHLLMHVPRPHLQLNLDFS